MAQCIGVVRLKCTFGTPLDNILPLLSSFFRSNVVVHAIDILLVALVNYQVLKLIKGTRALRVSLALTAFVLMLGLSHFLHLDTLYWLLDKAALLGPVALVILFFPELRQAMEGVLSLVPQIETTTTEARTIEELIAAMAELSSQSTGALVVIGRSASLSEIVNSGVELDAKISAPLMCSIFFEKNPLHDGAVVVMGDKIVAAACRLPLSETSRLDKSYHMRHRAAVGVTEALDCVALVVSEERGTMSLAINGRLEKINTVTDLRQRLNHELRGEEMGSPEKPRRTRMRRHREEVAK